MDISESYRRQRELAEQEFGHLVECGTVLRTPGGLAHKLRLSVVDGSVIDVFLSPSGRYSYHWERRPIDGTVYRHDNAPHRKWHHITTFPKHFHNGSEADGDVEASRLSDDPETAVREFLTFVAEVPAEAGRDDAM